MKDTIEKLLERISMSCLGINFNVKLEYDQKYSEEVEVGRARNKKTIGRLYLQIFYTSKCNKTGQLMEWFGRKYYLSDHMTPDEVVKTAFTAFKQAVEHEILEGFCVDNIPLFNPHVSFEELLKVSHLEVTREKELT